MKNSEIAEINEKNTFPLMFSTDHVKSLVDITTNAITLAKNATFINPLEGDELEIIQKSQVIWGYDEDGDIVEIHLIDGTLQSYLDRPAFRVIDKETGDERYLIWYDQGLEHRDSDGKPSSLSYYEAGKLCQRAWRQYGVGHRVGGPSLEFFERATQNLAYFEYRQHGIYFRPDGPAVGGISHINGVITLEIWYTRPGINKPSREDGKAAYIERDSNTNISTKKIWMRNGELFRPDNHPPIEIRDSKTGELVETRWELNEQEKNYLFQQEFGAEYNFIENNF